LGGCATPSETGLKNLPACLSAHLGEEFDEALGIHIVLEDRLATESEFVTLVALELHSASGW